MGAAAPNAREAAPDLAPRAKRAFGPGMQIALRRGLCGIFRWAKFAPVQTIQTRVLKKTNQYKHNEKNHFTPNYRRPQRWHPERVGKSTL
jgi:hypothetical protein